MGAAIELQRGIKLALETAGLTVCDFSAQDAPFPTVEIGHIFLTEWGTQTTDAFEFTARVYVRSRTTSAFETKFKQDEIYAALHRKPLTVIGHSCLQVWRDTTECTRQPDGSFLGLCEYRGQILTL